MYRSFIVKTIDGLFLNSLNEYEMKIVQYLMSNNSITLKITREVLDRGDSLAGRQLKSLETKGLISLLPTVHLQVRQQY